MQDPDEEVGEQSMSLDKSRKHVILDRLKNHVSNHEAFQNLYQFPFLVSDSFEQLQPEDIAYLGSNGSFTLPERRFTTVFIEQYFKKIHPVVPVLEEVQLWKSFQSDSEQTISLFVFQALLFASCPVSVDHRPERQEDSLIRNLRCAVCALEDPSRMWFFR